MEIKYVKQTYHTCGQASVAMVAGVPLAQAMLHFQRQKCTRSYDLHQALRELGFSSPMTLIRVNKNHGLPNLCIVKVCWYDRKGKRESASHWCLYHNGMFYDPESGIYTPDDYEQMIAMWKGKITSYLPIEEKL